MSRADRKTTQGYVATAVDALAAAYVAGHHGEPGTDAALRELDEDLGDVGTCAEAGDQELLADMATDWLIKASQLEAKT